MPFFFGRTFLFNSFRPIIIQGFQSCAGISCIYGWEQPNYHIWVNQMTTLVRSKDLWMYMEKKTLLYLMKTSKTQFARKGMNPLDWLLSMFSRTLFINDHTKNKESAKQIWDTFHTLFGKVNTTQVSGLENKLSNLKMANIASIEEYMARFKNLQIGINHIQLWHRKNTIKNMQVLF